ncbi:MAG: hypothetical protein HFG20_10585 [Anaerotruncus sp.]|nr:hypothetical protein [Anaerotruncus sp.]
MKKAIAALLAISASISVGVTAFADDINTVSDTAPSSSDSSSSDNSSSEDQKPVGEPTSLVFKADEDGVVLGDDILEPGKEYKFPVYLSYNGTEVAMNDENVKDYKFTYSRVSGTGMKTMEIKERKGTYYLYVEAKDTTSTKQTDVKYNVKLVRKSNNLSVFSQEVKFTYGYEEMDDDYISDLDKGDIIEIDSENPVITKSQFKSIAKINDYKNVTLAGPEWQFTVNVTDESTKNLSSTGAGIKEVMSKFPEQDFKFYSFPGKPSFAATGKMALDVSDIMDEFDKMYTYRYAGGKVYRMNATFNEEDSTLEFRTNRLDNFFVTDQAIKDGTVVADVDNDSSSDSSNNEASSKPNTDKNNPGTGASDMINAAVIAAIAAMGAAGVAAKKRSK